MTSTRFPILVARCYVLLVLGFIFLPIAVLVTFSFQEGRLPIPPFNGPSLKWYGEVLSGRDMIAALLTSLYVGAIAAFSAAILGFLLVYGVARFALPYRGVIEALMLAPASVPYGREQ